MKEKELKLSKTGSETWERETQISDGQETAYKLMGAQISPDDRGLCSSLQVMQCRCE